MLEIMRSHFIMIAIINSDQGSSTIERHSIVDTRVTTYDC